MANVLYVTGFPYGLSYRGRHRLVGWEQVADERNGSFPDHLFCLDLSRSTVAGCPHLTTQCGAALLRLRKSLRVLLTCHRYMGLVFACAALAITIVGGGRRGPHANGGPFGLAASAARR